MWSTFDFLLASVFASGLLFAFTVALYRSRQQLRLELSEVNRVQQDEWMEQKDLKAKQTFIAQLSHELRTPMNGIIGVLDLLQETTLSDEQHHYLDMACQASHTLLDLLNGVLDFSKAKEGKLLLEQIDFDLSAHLSEVINLFSLVCAQKEVTLTGQLSSSVPKIVRGDPTRIKQIFYNLVGNAVKFTQQGSITITGELISENKDSLELSFHIRDTGIGIPPESLETIFEQFSQAEISTSRHYGGTGLGLALCRQFVQLMDGEIHVVSEYGQGSCFIFTVKLKKALAAESLLSTASENKQHSAQWIHPKPLNQESRVQPHVLVVEDNHINRIVAVNRLQKLGCLVASVDDGQQALDLLAHEKFDLVLMDCQMPILNGYSATAKFRQHEKQQGIKTDARTLIVAMTANVMAQDKQKCLDAGMDDYLPKPIRTADLDRLMDRYQLAHSKNF